MIFTNCSLLHPYGHFTKDDLHFDETILQLGKSPADAEKIDGLGGYLVPGLVDIHSHGAMNQDASDPNPEKMEILSAYYPTVGVTSWCPTTMSLDESTLLTAVETIAAYQNPVGAKVAGIYLEGPFFSQAKKGAQSGKNLIDPDQNLLQKLEKASGNNIAVLALAPELEGGLELIAQVKDRITLSLAHSAADFHCASQAFDQGATLVTHLFNGMLPFAHRDPGIIGAALDKRAYVEIIADGLHIHPTVLRATHQLFGEKLCLISDSIRCAGMPDGNYTLGGQNVTKTDGKVTLPDGTLAGSAIGLLDAVHNMISYGIPPQDAFYAASTAPAHAIGKDKEIGSLEKGKSADFLHLDENFQLISTYVQGKKVYSAQ